jgi:predicted lipoprotein with Yx(FWY)xxD motif
MLTAAGAAVAGAVLLAACGGSTTHTAASPAAGAASEHDVTTKQAANLGSILADGKGLTLYTLTDNGKAVTCTGACAAVWPPLTSASGAPVTAGGLPLYRFVQDRDSEDTYGEGMASFGGVWHVVKAGSSTGALSSTRSAGSY